MQLVTSGDDTEYHGWNGYSLGDEGMEKRDLGIREGTFE